MGLTRLRSLNRLAARRIARRRLRRSLRERDTFLVAYPKSGTNWIGYFLGCVIADRNLRRREPLTLKSYREWVPDVNEEYFSKGSLTEYRHLPDPRIFTVHAPFDRQLPRVICLVRDPRSVLVSYYYHKRREQVDFCLSIDEFIQGGSAFRQDWGNFVGGWLRNGDPVRTLLARYEDLRRDPVASFQRILRFCGLELSEAETRKFVEISSFNRMRKVSLPFSETGCARDIPFVRRGSLDEWREKLNPTSVMAIERRFSRLMDRLGYEPSYARADGDDSKTRAGAAPASTGGSTVPTVGGL